jgi:hypothetical protein
VQLPFRDVLHHGGWRLGYLYGPKEIVDTAKRVHERFSNSSSAPLMEAAVAGLMFPDAYYEALKATYTANAPSLLQRARCSWHPLYPAAGHLLCALRHLRLLHGVRHPLRARVCTPGSAWRAFLPPTSSSIRSAATSASTLHARTRILNDAPGAHGAGKAPPRLGALRR